MYWGIRRPIPGIMQRPALCFLGLIWNEFLCESETFRMETGSVEFSAGASRDPICPAFLWGMRSACSRRFSLDRRGADGRFGEGGANAIRALNCAARICSGSPGGSEAAPGWKAARTRRAGKPIAAGRDAGRSGMSSGSGKGGFACGPGVESVFPDCHRGGLFNSIPRVSPRGLLEAGSRT